MTAKLFRMNDELVEECMGQPEDIDRQISGALVWMLALQEGYMVDEVLSMCLSARRWGTDGSDPANHGLEVRSC